MAGYLITGNMSNAWSIIEEYSEPKHILENSGYCIILKPEENGKNYTVSDLDQLFQFLPDAMSHQKYCIIPNAETLSEILQNKLLKSLEDSSTIFFLVTNNEHAMLSTVKSRLVKIRLPYQPPAESEMVANMFSSINKREDMLVYLDMDADKNAESLFNTMNPHLFIQEVEKVFLKLLGHYSWGESCIPSMEKLWNNADSCIKACSICERYEKLTTLTKDYFFVFIAELIEI